MAELNKNNFGGIKKFFDTYPRLIPVIVFILGFLLGCLWSKLASEEKTEAEKTYDAQVWRTRAAKEQVIQEGLADKFVVDKATAEKEAAQVELDAAVLYDEAIRKKAEAKAYAIQVIGDAEIKRNKQLGETLTSDLMDYFRWKNACTVSVSSDQEP